jgi:hypothetical protein
MDNGHSKPVELITPTPLEDAFKLVCHRMYIPIAIPVQDPLNPRAAKMQATISNVHCVKEKCTLWNAEAGECWDVSAKRGMALAGQIAYDKATFQRITSGGDQ